MKLPALLLLALLFADPVAVVRGVVTEVDARGGMVTLKHEAVPAMGLEADTTTFQAEPAVTGKVKVGDKVELTMEDANESTVATKVKVVSTTP